MWVFDTTLYQMYPLGMLDCPFDAPAVDDAEGQERERSLHRVRSLIEWAPYLGKLGVGAILLNPVFASDSHGYNRVTCAKSTTGWARTRTSPAWSTLYTHAASA